MPAKKAKDIPEMEDLKKIGDDFVKLGKKLKDRFDDLDDNTKKKVIGGIAGTATVLMGLHTIKKAAKKRAKRKKK